MASASRPVQLGRKHGRLAEVGLAPDPRGDMSAWSQVLPGSNCRQPAARAAWEHGLPGAIALEKLAPRANTSMKSDCSRRASTSEGAAEIGPHEGRAAPWRRPGSAPAEIRVARSSPAPAMSAPRRSCSQTSSLRGGADSGRRSRPAKSAPERLLRIKIKWLSKHRALEDRRGEVHLHRGSPGNSQHTRTRQIDALHHAFDEVAFAQHRVREARLGQIALHGKRRPRGAGCRSKSARVAARGDMSRSRRSPSSAPRRGCTCRGARRPRARQPGAGEVAEGGASRHAGWVDDRSAPASFA